MKSNQQVDDFPDIASRDANFTLNFCLSYGKHILSISPFKLYAVKKSQNGIWTEFIGIFSAIIIMESINGLVQSFIVHSLLSCVIVS